LQEDAKEERVQAKRAWWLVSCPGAAWIRARDEQGLPCTKLDSATSATLDDVSGGVGRQFGRVALPSGQPGGDEQKCRRYFRPEKLLLLMACAFVLSGLLLLSKTLDEVDLDTRFNVDMAIGRSLLAESSSWPGSFALCPFSGSSLT
jgi:hypothetical protein